MRDFHLPGRSAVYATGAICATSGPVAAQAGIQMLREGGNAVDACTAMAFVLGISEPASCGIGGDLFVLLKPAGEERVVSLNASGRAPAGLSAEAMRAKGWKAVDQYQAEAITLPGAIDGFCRLCADWGRKGLEAALQPAIHYAEAGIPAGPRTAADWARGAHVLQGEARRFYLKDDRPLAVGDIFRHPEQAEVLRRIAREGRAGFYEGEVAEDMVASLQALGGSHTLEDFANVACTYTEPVSGTYRNVELIEHPPNGQGATAILLANILSHFDIAEMEPWGQERTHIEAEATKLAYDARDRFIADADHMTRLEHMLASETARDLAALIRPDAVIESARKASGAVHKDTVYITAVDEDGMAVSLIYSIFHGFGSGLASSKYGILFQNRGAGFTLEEGHANEAAPGKRPLHTIIPAMLREGGRISQAFGVMGGQYQPAGHARVLTNQVDFGLDVQEALDGPRAFPEGGKLWVERGFGDDVRAGLAALGHKVEVPVAPHGGGQAIRIDHARGVLVGGSDPRKDGCAIGY